MNNLDNAQELMCEIISMQRELDASIYDKKNKEYSEPKCYMALGDELGEFTHELKNGWVDSKGEVHAPWCWWKDKLSAPDRSKMVEEYVDCLHFAMSIWYHFFDANKSEFNSPYQVEHNPINTFSLMVNTSCKNEEERYKKTIMIISKMYSCTPNLILGYLVALGSLYDIGIEEIHTEYMKKNKVNYERLAKGY